MLSGDLDLAIKDIDAALSQGNIDPVSKSKLNVEKGVLYAQKRDNSSAEVYFTRAIGLDSNNALSYYHRGMARIEMYKIQSAASDLILARQKGLSSTNIAPGIGHSDSALQNYWKFVAFQPSEMPSSFNYVMGNIYMNLGKYDSSYRYLIRSFRSDSSNGYVLYSMASCIYLQGNIETSLEWFERSFQTNALKRSFVDHDMLLGSLQDDKRFRNLKKKYL
jgi:tetratricopeptide (TPR) repeat protein